jgi:putative NADPH-quinone reductase
MTAEHILVLYAHPAPQRSPANRRLVEIARSMSGVRVQDLYELYPDFDIDGERERALLLDARLVIFLHPFRWYGMPSLMKEWMEIVLQPGWAYGRGQCALRGKAYWLVTTTGSGLESFQPGGLHGRPFADFLAPFEQTAALCGMEWLAPLVLHGTARNEAALIEEHAREFRRRLADYAGIAPGDASLAETAPFGGEG